MMMLQYIDHIVLPYITKVGESLLALVIMDNFKDTMLEKMCMLFIYHPMLR